ncbi:conjugative transfer signal peptidase TraF [Xanthomonas hortorum]|uniref:conjugative transfer signal peptidase TraF n=1 Tax=Xanthomonas hortorum TaxID=56454 RepID=UPI000CEE34EB|nr:conjugative transfer signal peptidase TraF [Xanthomonas hortorum]MCE4369665.1 conjugative transfer signal peptidase TraF [Xanthomonas hortorum pv. hederae]PPU86208.1 conjugative transfer signal peptidase TraF [Xanthomonas hortorum pv. hederae]PUF01271.1 conjugative transfer signal peptidase TraF [Xanthomonas hortorum pv. hederae]
MASQRACPHLHVPGWVLRASGTLRDFFRHARRRWYLYLPLLAIWTLAYVRLFFLPVPYTPVLFNWTPSLPYRVAVLRPLTAPPAKGDYILYRFAGPAEAQYPALRGQPFFKRVSGVPGDEVAVIGRRVYVNSELVGEAKPRTFDGRTLWTIQPTVIPEGHYFVSGTSPDSFDSRYRASGLVRSDQIIGRVEPWF